MVSPHSEKKRCGDSRKHRHLRMAAAQPSSPAPSSPDLEGYDSALEEVTTLRQRIGESGSNSMSSDESNRFIRTPLQRVSLIGANQEPVRGRAGTLPARDARGRFTRHCGSARSADSAASSDSGRSQRSSSVGREIGSATDLVSSQQSLAWDNFTPPIQQEDDLIFYYKTSSTSGLASNTLQERELEQFIEEPDRLTPVDERGESRASTGEHERTMAGENAAGGPVDDVVAPALLDYIISLQCAWIKRVTQHWGDNWRYDLKKKCYGNPLIANWLTATFGPRENPILHNICNSFKIFKKKFTSIEENYKKALIFRNPLFRRGRNDDRMLCEGFFGNNFEELKNIAKLKFEDFLGVWRRN
jgi:hypothetical protein